MITASLGYARRGGWAGISVTACGSKGSGQKIISYSGFLSVLEAGHECHEVGARAWEAVAHMLGGCYSIYT